MDNKTKKFVIDFKDVKGIYDMFEIISIDMDFPIILVTIGILFWDCMTDIICINLEIEIHNLDALDSELRENKEKLICLLNELKHLNNDEWCDITTIKIQDGKDIYYIDCFLGAFTSQFGRALHWQCRGQRFDPAMLHQKKSHDSVTFFFLFFSLFSTRFSLFSKRVHFQKI